MTQTSPRVLKGELREPETNRQVSRPVVHGRMAKWPTGLKGGIHKFDKKKLLISR